MLDSLLAVLVAAAVLPAALLAVELFATLLLRGSVVLLGKLLLSLTALLELLSLLAAAVGLVEELAGLIVGSRWMLLVQTTSVSRLGVTATTS